VALGSPGPAGPAGPLLAGGLARPARAGRAFLARWLWLSSFVPAFVVRSLAGPFPRAGQAATEVAGAPPAVEIPGSRSRSGARGAESSCAACRPTDRRAILRPSSSPRARAAARAARRARWGPPASGCSAPGVARPSCCRRRAGRPPPLRSPLRPPSNSRSSSRSASSRLPLGPPRSGSRSYPKALCLRRSTPCDMLGIDN
jgi:hypothetical protein